MGQLVNENWNGWPPVSLTAPAEATAARLESAIDDARSRGVDPGGDIHAVQFGAATVRLVRRLDGYSWIWVAEAVCGDSVGSRVETIDCTRAVSHWQWLHDHWRRALA